MTVATSSTEAELNAAFEATKEIIYFRDLLDSLGYPQLEPTTLFVDNSSLITLATRYSGNSKRVKHYLMRVSYLIEKVNEHAIHLEYLQTELMKADVLTKALFPAAHIPLGKDLLGPQRDRRRVISFKLS